MQKVYWDNVNGKEVVDISGVRVVADVIAEYSLDASTQTIDIDPAIEAPKVTGGVLGKISTVPTADEVRTEEIFKRFSGIDSERIRLLGDDNQGVVMVLKGGKNQSPTLHLTDLETEAQTLRDELSAM